MDTAKLPKRARDHIHKLESDLASVRQALAERNGEFVGGRILINAYDDDRMVFHDRSTVRFVVAEGWQGYFDVRLVDGGIEVSGGGPMSIEPRVTNVITARIVG